jgi:TRAP-type mannitol/chloroaromatic compound transport system permease large subunit
VVYLKSTLVGLLTVVSALILFILVGVIYFSVMLRSMQGSIRSTEGSVGWDPISLAKPLTWLVLAAGIFLIGFFWEFSRLRSK